jgi:hypothetical protein
MRHDRRTVTCVLIGSIVLSLFAQGCFHHRHDRDDDSIIGSGRMVSEERTVAQCSSIRIVGSAKIFLTQDSQQRIRVEADDNIIDQVTTRYENGYLVVGLERGSYSNTTINVYVSLATIENLEITGAGDITTSHSIQCDAVRCHIEGAGNISLAGTANIQTITIDGAGNVGNFDLVSSDCTAIINGTGNCEVHVTHRFDGQINGVGKIVYEGNPSEVYKSINGLGSINPR